VPGLPDVQRGNEQVGRRLRRVLLVGQDRIRGAGSGTLESYIPS
jgi:hypothetical protein